MYYIYKWSVGLGGLVVIVLATGLIVRGFKFSGGERFLRAIKSVAHFLRSRSKAVDHMP
jgi:hypothetical protein